MATRLVSVKELSKIIEMPPYTIRKKVRLGEFPAYKLDKKNYRFDPDEILKIATNKEHKIN